MSALLALLVALGQLPAPQLARPGETVTLRSDLAELDTAEDRLQAEGNVVLRSGGLRLLTHELDYGLDTREGAAGGELLLFDGTLVIRAREGLFSLGEGGELSLEDAELWQKASVSAALDGAGDALAAKRAGRNLLLLKAEHLDRVRRGKFLATRLRLTPCDCGEEASPDWSLEASEADVEPGERAILWWPKLYIKDLPVFVLPALYVPLSPRRTGFLFPRPGYHAQSGFLVDAPFFWALDESHDLTLTLGYRLGVSDFDSETGLYKRVGVQGPRASAELRYVPAEHTSGRLFLSATYDLHGEPDSATASQALRPARGWRGELSFRHGTDFDGLGARADLNLVSDANYRGDQVADVLNEAPPYLRSQAWGGYRGAAVAASVSAQWYQDMAAPFAAEVPEHWFFGSSAPAGFQRPVALDLRLPTMSLLGPVRGGLEIHGSRLQALSLLAGPTLQGALALTRLDLAPSLSWPLLARAPVSVELYAGGRGDLAHYSEAGAAQTLLQGRAWAGAWAGTELSRTFDSGSLKHSIEPRVEVRAASQRVGDSLVLGQGLVKPVDEFDERPDGFVQGVASLASRLVRKGGGDLVRLELAQGIDLGAGRLADSVGQLVVSPAYVQLSSSARWDWQRRTFSAVAAALRVSDTRGDALELRYDRVLELGTGQMRAALDALFAASRLDLSARELEFNQVTLALAVTIIQGITLRYGAVMAPDMPTPFLRRVFQHTGAVGLGSSCDCWRLDAFVTYAQGADAPSFGFLLDLKSLGRFGQ